MTNPNWGVFYLETFVEIDNNGQDYSRVFDLGLITTRWRSYNYYLTDYFENTAEGSANLVLKCIDKMFSPKYHIFFYVHNLGIFYVVFLQKFLLDYNLNI